MSDARTFSEAEPVAPSTVALTTCDPVADAVQTFSVQEPSGTIEKAASLVTSPSELSYASRPSAVNGCDPPGAIVAGAGDSARWSSAPGVTVMPNVPVFPPYVAVTVCAPAAVAVQTLPVQDPSGEIENVVPDVTSPRELS